MVKNCENPILGLSHNYAEELNKIRNWANEEKDEPKITF
jgi:hypothetical protein